MTEDILEKLKIVIPQKINENYGISVRVHGRNPKSILVLEEAINGEILVLSGIIIGFIVLKI